MQTKGKVEGSSPAKAAPPAGTQAARAAFVGKASWAGVVAGGPAAAAGAAATAATAAAAAAGSPAAVADDSVAALAPVCRADDVPPPFVYKGSGDGGVRDATIEICTQQLAFASILTFFRPSGAS
jgi:hypothetical protein